MLENAVRICDAKFGSLFRYNTETFDRSLFGALELRKPVQSVAAFLDDPDYRLRKRTPHWRGFATRLGLPLLREGSADRHTVVVSRTTVQPFDDRHIELLHIRGPGGHRSREHATAQRCYASSLEQQTATSKVLEVISRAGFDLRGGV